MLGQRTSNGLGRAAAGLVLAAAILVPTAAWALFAPSANLWDRWAAHDAASVQTIDHAAWDEFLTAYVVPGPDGLNRFAYGRVTGNDRATLDAYVAALTGTQVSALNRRERSTP